MSFNEKEETWKRQKDILEKISNIDMISRSFAVSKNVVYF